jgi:hypothetical protein
VKIKPIVLALALTFVGGFAFGADHVKDVKQAKTQTPEKAKSPVASKKKKQKNDTPLTGSYLQQRVRRNGQITDGPSQLLVLDSDAIQRTGATDIKQALSRSGIH